jgi:1-deoxy-D-xylulose-5-phosphate reductoisomerase
MTDSTDAPARRLVVLGATGSVGAATLDVVARHPDRYRVVALTGGRRVEELFRACLAHRPRYAVVTEPAGARDLAQRLRAEGLPTEVLCGPQALVDIAAHPEVDTVMAAIVGAAGLAPCLAAARAGKRLLLANKEALVVGGRLFVDAVADGGATLLPIDSEHSAIFQCLPEDRATWRERIDHVVLTASGGPFRGRRQEELAHVTRAEALAHPTWQMGPKITIDSATLMNKALEVIEARWLFDLEPDRIRVVVHPQSVIHSMVAYRDGSVLAQLGTADMRVPIAVGLAHPERIASGSAAPDWSALGSLTFEDADRAVYPALGLAYDALAAADGTTAVLNAANEVAVEAFLAGTIRYDAILRTVSRTVDSLAPPAGASASLDALLALDADARVRAREHLAEHAR